jgi:peptidoglycan hydrolase-like protein with peptidoglycan-binding domain
MRKRALLGTAALLAGVAMASAQTMPQGESQSGMSSQSGGQAPQMQQQQRGGESQRSMQEQRGESRDGMRAQQPQQRQEPAQDRTSGQAQRESEPRRDAQPKQQSEKQQSDQQKDRTSGQAQRDSEPRRDAQPKQQSDQQKDRTQDRAGTRDRGNQDKAAARPDAQGRVNLSSEHRTRIQRTVFARANLPRVSRVDFALHVGTVIPTHVAIVDVPPALIEINPSWRSHKFFVVEEDIIVVSPERKIVAVVPVGRDRAGISAGSSALALDLPPEEIRIIQQVLIDRGFDVEVDGVFGTRTRQALITFQRRQGLQATGSIDTRTVAKLGVQDRVKLKGDADRAATDGSSARAQANKPQDPQQRESSGQGRDAKQQPQQRETSGQGSSDAKQQPQQRETSGQGSSDAKQQPQASGSADRSAEPQLRPSAGESPSSSGGSSRY